MKRALTLSYTSNEIQNMDLRAINRGLRRAGYQVDSFSSRELAEQISEMPVEEYDLIVQPAMFSAMFLSRTYNHRVISEIYNRAKDGALALLFCDVTYRIEGRVWDPKDIENTKLDYLVGRPYKAIGSFSADILQSKSAMELIQQKHLRPLHPDSTFHPIEWLSYHYSEDELTPLEDQPDPSGEQIKSFYYGFRKPRMKKSLIELGLGQSEEDALYGPMAGLFPNVRDLSPSKARRTRDAWIPFAKAAERVLIPYEAVKSEYQVTLRLLESMEFYGETVVFDPRISERMIPFAKSTDPWDALQTLTAEQLAAL